MSSEGFTGPFMVTWRILGFHLAHSGRCGIEILRWQQQYHPDCLYTSSRVTCSVCMAECKKQSRNNWNPSCWKSPASLFLNLRCNDKYFCQLNLFCSISSPSPLLCVVLLVLNLWDSGAGRIGITAPCLASWEWHQVLLSLHNLVLETAF